MHLLFEYNKDKVYSSQIKKISVFRVTGMKSLGKVGTHVFFNNFFLEKYIILCILKGNMPFKMHKIIFFLENLKKYLGFTSKLR